MYLNDLCRGPISKRSHMGRWALHLGLWGDTSISAAAAVPRGHLLRLSLKARVCHCHGNGPRPLFCSRVTLGVILCAR